MSSDGIAYRLLQTTRKIFIILFVGQLIYIIILRWVDPPITVTQLSSLLQGNGLKRDYISKEKISPYAALSVMAAEDQLFPEHTGFDLKSIKKAFENNRKKRSRIKGASTITQQVAKNVFLWQGRSWIRKGLEAYFTFMIEVIWSKERILEMYLNVAEMGKGVFGIEAASQKYFKKPAKRMTKTEAATIAACLPNPKKYKVNPISAYVGRRQVWILRQMNNLENDPDIERLLKSFYKK